MAAPDLKLLALAIRVVVERRGYIDISTMDVIFGLPSITAVASELAEAYEEVEKELDAQAQSSPQGEST